MSHDTERTSLQDGIQAAFAEHEDGALVTGWFLIAEARRPNGRSFLAYRTGDINGDGLSSWTSLGFLHSAVGAVEEQAADLARDPGEDA